MKNEKANKREGETSSAEMSRAEDLLRARLSEQEEALRESESRFRSLADNAPVMIWVTDPTGYCTYLSKAWYDFTGQSEAEALGFGWVAATHPDDQAMAHAAFVDANARQAPFRIEYRLRNKAGEYRWAIDAAMPRFGDDGEYLGFVGSVIDITERRQAEQRERERDEQFRTLADSIPQLAWMAQPDGHIFWYNRRWYDYTGTTFDEMEGWGWKSVHDPEQVDRVVANFRRALDTGEGWEDTFPLKSRSGEFRRFLSRALPIRDDAGQIVRWFGTNTDVEERLRTEERSRASEQRFRSIFNGQFQFIAILSPEGVLQDINDLALRGTGVAREQVVGKVFWETFWWENLPEMRAGWRARLDKAARTGAPVLSVDSYQVGDEVRTADASVTAVKDANGRIEFFIIQASDITERARAEEALRRSEELSQSVLSSLDAHIAVLDRDGVILHVNEAWRRFTAENTDPNAPAPDSIGTNYLAVCQPAGTPANGDAERAQKGIRAVLGGTSRSFQMEYPCHAPDRERWFLLNATPLASGRGGVVSHTDITERKRAEEQLLQSEQRYRQLADVVPQLVWETDAEGKHLYYNQQWYDYTGLGVEESMGYGFALALHPDDKPRTLKNWERAWRDGEPYNIEYRFYSRPQGIYRWFLGRATPVRDAGGKITRWVGTCTNIDDQKQMAAQLERLNAERAAMLEEVSTPVVPVLPGVLALPLIGSLDTDRMQRATEAALAEVTRTGAHTCIIDITGARIIDSFAVANLANLVGALRLIGAEAIVTGVSAQAAQSLVGLGLDFAQVRTQRTLAEALSSVANRNTKQRINHQGTGFTVNGITSNTR